MSGNHFDIQGNCDLGHRPSNPKINEAYLLDMANLDVKYENFVVNGFQDNQRKPYGLPTDISKTIYPIFFERGHNKYTLK